MTLSFFETGSTHVDQVGLELIEACTTPELSSQAYRHALPYLASHSHSVVEQTVTFAHADAGEGSGHAQLSRVLSSSISLQL